MKISIITVCFNSEKTIAQTIESVLSQNSVSLEYIIIDGLSTDNTLKIIESYQSRFNDKGIIYKWISEKDNGIYDAMNKGINMATGDIIGILNSDDRYTDGNVLHKVVDIFTNNEIDCCFGNILYIKGNKPYRYWKAGKPRTFKYGWMPPHPAFFVKKSIYEKYGLFRLDCGVNADYELMLRFLEKYNIRSTWINKIFVYMNAGGKSNNGVKSRLDGIIDNKKAWMVNKMKPLFFTIFLKKIRKLPQYIYAYFIHINLGE